MGDIMKCYDSLPEQAGVFIPLQLNEAEEFAIDYTDQASPFIFIILKDDEDSERVAKIIEVLQVNGYEVKFNSMPTTYKEFEFKGLRIEKKYISTYDIKNIKAILKNQDNFEISTPKQQQSILN